MAASYIVTSKGNIHFIAISGCVSHCTVNLNQFHSFGHFPQTLEVLHQKMPQELTILQLV